MTRRGFLRLLGLAPAGVVAAPRLLEKMATKPSWPWVISGWWQKEFGYGRDLGTAVAARNVVTGEIRRNGIRAYVHIPFQDGIRRATEGSVARLKDWAKLLNEPWRRNVLGTGVVGDEILEGREHRQDTDQRGRV